ncbi:hypothetical protein [Archangium sp.]|uniref:hypothetical protein n=1 Tax=Archangium sp. TaxID=1872627 RepID=UPI00286AD9FF|nr:hypothetical protein [Archangium sp.]
MLFDLPPTRTWVAALLLCLTLAPAARAATIPEVRYTLGGTRKLLFVNNPEQLYTQDLGDSNHGNKIILTATATPGGWRNYFEHMNRSGYTLGYGIQLYNPNAFAVTVAVHGSGWVTNAYGGAPWRQLFNAYSQAGTSYTVPAYGVLWVMRKDASIPNGNFFSGVVDFTVSGGSVQVHNYAYRSFAAINGTAQYMGYVRRISPYNNHNESLVYKGTSPYTEAIATQVNFTFTDSDRDELAVSHPNYDLSAGGYTPSYVRQSGWYTNIGPAMNSYAITQDMISIDTPGWGVISPLTRSDGLNAYPNFGNWGVVYKLSGTLTNKGTYTRNVSINLRASPDYVVIAYKGSDGKWYEYNLQPNEYIQYAWVSVPPTGQPVPYEASFVLGGPASGNLFQAVAINN